MVSSHVGNIHFKNTTILSTSFCKFVVHQLFNFFIQLAHTTWNATWTCYLMRSMVQVGENVYSLLDIFNINWKSPVIGGTGRQMIIVVKCVYKTFSCVSVLTVVYEHIICLNCNQLLKWDWTIQEIN